MTSHVSRVVLMVMGTVGWILACIFGALACMLAIDARGNDVPWQILGAMVLGPMLASIPVCITLLAAYRAFGDQLPSKPLSSLNSAGFEGATNWRWVAFAVLGVVELLVLPLTIVAANAEDDTLVLSIPLNIGLLTALLLVGCLPYRNRASIAFCVIHLVGIALASFAAALEIESVMISGLILLVTGIVVALIGPSPRAARAVFGLSTVAFAVIAFSGIAINGVSKQDADAPLFAAIVAYQVLFVPLGLWVLYCEISRTQQPLRVQFGIKHLLTLMLLVGAALAAGRIAFTRHDDVRIVVALGLAGLMASGIAVAIGGGWAKWSNKTFGQKKPQLA